MATIEIVFLETPLECQYVYHTEDDLIELLEVSIGGVYCHAMFDSLGAIGAIENAIADKLKKGD
jgi:hypothetical protein